MGPKMEIRGIAEVGVVGCVESPEGPQEESFREGMSTGSARQSSRS